MPPRRSVVPAIVLSCWLGAVVSPASGAPVDRERPWRVASYTKAELTKGNARMARFVAVSDFDYLPDGTGRAFLSVSSGRVFLIDPSFRLLSSFDLPSSWNSDAGDPATLSDNEGLIGLAIDPDFARNGFLYLQLNDHPTAGVSVWRVKWTAASPSETWKQRKLLLQTRKDPKRGFQGLHNGGNLSIGPDGHLYVPIGNGSAPGTTLPETLGPSRVEQIDGSPWGKLWKVDIRRDAQPKIVAKGLRNPFSSFWYGNLLFLGEPGTWIEEIDVFDYTTADRGVVNFASGLFEGPCRGRPDCDKLREPVLYYDRSRKMLEDAFGETGVSRKDEAQSLASCIILGPPISPRSQRYPALRGRLIYLDAVQGWARSAAIGPDGALSDDRFLTAVPGFVTKAIEAPDGHVYFISGYNETIHVDRLPGSGVFTASTPDRPLYVRPAELTGELPKRFIPYDIRLPASHGDRIVERFVAVPRGEKITLDGDELSFPVGTAFVQRFFARSATGGGRALERIRITERRANNFAFLELVPQGRKLVYDPAASGRCAACHNRQAVLGFTETQLALPDDSNGRKFMGILIRRLPDPLPLSTAEERARGYLHANCAACHGPEGRPGPTLGFRLDWKGSASLATAVSSRSGKRLIVPGDPQASLLYQAATWDARAPRMPPIDADAPHPEAEQALGNWIREVKPTIRTRMDAASGILRRWLRRTEAVPACDSGRCG